MTDSTSTYTDLSEEEDSTDITLDDLDTLPIKDPICKNLSIAEFSTPKLLNRESMHNREHMKVYLRIRPFTDTEIEQGESQETMSVSQTSLTMHAPKDSFAFKSSQRGFGDMTHKFTFTKIFNEDTTQKTLFDETLLGTVKDFVDGQNCLIFTYGVTNAGKTHTIQGTPQDGGILPRSLDVVFNSIEGQQFSGMGIKPRYFCDVVKLGNKQLIQEEEAKCRVLALAENESNPKQYIEDDSLAESDTSKGSHYSTATEESVLEGTQDTSKTIEGFPNVLEDIKARIPDDTSIDVEAQGPIHFSIWVSFAEIYNEYIYDLLQPIPKGKKVRRQPLKLASDKNGSIFIKGLQEVQCDSADEAYKILKIGQSNRSIASTKLNQCSSRSHCIFSIKILRVVDVDDPHVARVSKLSFCDLAGSERYTRTQNTGERLKEAGNINTSLLTLGKCIHTLRYNQNHPKVNPKMIPFRESKLTRLFQSFFQGKGKAHMIVNVNQCASGFDETMHVLKFSAIAKQVTTVTSKLDNQWKKIPPKLASARTVSLVINQAGNAARDRPSISWATPGKQVAEELGDLDVIDESVMESEEEEDDDVEESDLEATPMGDKSMLQGSSTVSRLKAVIEVLKNELIQEKHKAFTMEVALREEICQEMAEHIVQIEEDYNERLQEEKEINEERYERKLELYTKSVKKANKRRKKDDDDDDEYVSSAVLAAEQLKLQQRDAKIEDLECIIEKLKSESAEDEEKMTAQNQALIELQSVVEENKSTVEEANQRLCYKETLLEQIQSQLQRYKDTSETQKSQLDELTDRVNSTEASLLEQRAMCESLKQELANKKDAKHTIAESPRLEEKDNQMGELQNAGAASSEHAELKTLNEELSQKVKATETALDRHVSLLEEKERQIAEFKDASESATRQGSELKQKGDETMTFETHEQAITIEHLEETVIRAKKAVSDLQEKLDANREEHHLEVIELQSQLTSTQDQLSSKVEEIEHHQNTITGLQEGEQEKTIKIEHLEEEERRAKQTAFDLQERLDATREEHRLECTELQSQLTSTQNQLSTSGKEVDHLQNTNTGLQEKENEQAIMIEHLNDDVKKANKTVFDLQEKLDAAQIEHSLEYTELKSKLTSTQDQLSTKADEIHHLQNINKGLQEEGYEHKNNLEHLEDLKRAKKTVSDLQEKLNAVQKEHNVECTKLQSQLMSTQDQLSNRVMEIEHLQNTITGLKKGGQEQIIKIEHLEEEVRQTKQTSCDLQERLDAANEEHRLERTELLSQLTAAQDQLSSRVKEIEHIQEEHVLQMKNMTSQLASAHQVNTEIKNKEHMGVERIESLNLETEKLRADMIQMREKHESNLQVENKQKVCLSEELEKAKADLLALEQDSQGKVEKLNNSINKITCELEKSQGDVKRVRTEANKLTTEIEHLQEQLQESAMATVTEKKGNDKLQLKVQATEMAVKDAESLTELLKNQIKVSESELENEKTMNKELSDKVKELEELESDLQQRIDEANNTGQQATLRIMSLEESLAEAQEKLAVEQKAHESTKAAVFSSEASVSDMRISLEMAERTASSMARQVKRTKELEVEMNETKRVLAEKIEELEKLSSVTGDASETSSKLEQLKEKLQMSEQCHQMTQQTLQSTLGKCSSLEQSLEAKKDCVRDQQVRMERMEEDLEAKRLEVTKMQDNQTHLSGETKSQEETNRRLEQELAGKTSTINMLMKKMEKKCQELKAAQQQVKAAELDVETLKSALQEQEEAMAEQDRILSSKEEDFKGVHDEVEALQEKYATIMTTSADDQKALRKAQSDLARFTDDKEAQKKNQDARDAELEAAAKKEEELTNTVKALQETLEETNQEVNNLEKEFGIARAELAIKVEELEKAQTEFERSQLELEKMQEQCEKNQKELKERRKEVTRMREEMVKAVGEEAGRNRAGSDEKIAELENKLVEQEKAKEKELSEWRKERDSILTALEKELYSLQEKVRKATNALKDKDEYIKQLKEEMQEHMSQSAAFTEDDDSESQDDKKRATKRGSARTSHEKAKRLTRSKLIQEDDTSDASEPSKTRSHRRQQNLEVVKEEPVVSEDERVADEAAVETNEPLYNRREDQEEEPIYEEPPIDMGNKSGFSSSSSSDTNRLPSMVIMEPDDNDASRVEMDVTPLQKYTRKTRNARRGKKRTSTDMLYDELDSASSKMTQSKSTRGRRRTRAACKETEETENPTTGYAANGPLPPPGRSSKRGLAKIGDMFQNSPFGKSAGTTTNKVVSSPSRSCTAKKLVDNMHSPKQSPPRMVDVTVAGTDTKKRRKLYKTEISTPYKCSPHETLSQQVEGAKQDEIYRAVEPPKKADNSHNIVTRKLRSRQKKF